jgi:hypothetical protein
MPNPTLKLHGFTFSELFHAEGLKRLDEQFLTTLKRASPKDHAGLLSYREGTYTTTPLAVSELLLACSPVLEDFLIQLFGIEEAAAMAQARTLSYNPISAFKKYFVLRRAKKHLARYLAECRTSTSTIKSP